MMMPQNVTEETKTGLQYDGGKPELLMTARRRFSFGSARLVLVSAVVFEYDFAACCPVVLWVIAVLVVFVLAAACARKCADDVVLSS